MANRTGDVVEGQAAIAAGESVIATLRPLNAHQRAWAVMMVLAEFSIEDPTFVERIVFIMNRTANRL